MLNQESCRYINNNISDNSCNQSFNETLFGESNGSDMNRIAFLVLGALGYVVAWPFLVYDFKCVPFGRVAAVLFGSLLMVVFTVISQEEVFCILGQNDNLQTLCLLLGMMMFGYYLEREGLLSYLLTRLLHKNRSFNLILWLLCLMTAALSALITNNATCVLLTPLILQEHVRQKRSKREYLPLLLGIATSANIGSAATVMGNPQNIYIAAKGDINLAQTFLSLFPAAMVGLVINTLLLYAYTYLFYLRKRKTETETDSLVTSKDIMEITVSVAVSKSKQPEELKEPKPINKCKKIFFSSAVVFFLLLTVTLLCVPPNENINFDLGLVPVGCAGVLMVLDGVVNKESGSRLVRHIDWSVILLFCGLFVWLEGFKKTNLPKAVFLELKGFMSIDSVLGVLVFTLFIIVGSNLLSNVPMVFLIVDYVRCLPGVSDSDGSVIVASLLLAWVSTVAGNFTLFGSVANLIVAEKAKRHIDYTLGFFSYLLFVLLSTFVVLFVGLPIVYFLGKVASGIV